nr:hypothetical protein [Agrobacterium larrymoorei]
MSYRQCADEVNLDDPSNCIDGRSAWMIVLKIEYASIIDDDIQPAMCMCDTLSCCTDTPLICDIN